MRPTSGSGPNSVNFGQIFGQALANVVPDSADSGQKQPKLVKLGSHLIGVGLNLGKLIQNSAVSGQTGPNGANFGQDVVEVGPSLDTIAPGRPVSANIGRVGLNLGQSWPDSTGVGQQLGDDHARWLLCNGLSERPSQMRQ